MSKSARLAITMTLISLVYAGFIGFAYVYSNWQFENTILSNWNLADKSSTIVEKSRYVTAFVEVLDKSGLQGKHNAVFLKTPDNSFDNNVEAIRSLQKRLEEIDEMDVKSFEYQTAIQQITQQEQGEAGRILSVIRGVWMKENCILIWDWVRWITLTPLMIIGFVALSAWLAVVDGH